MRRGIVLAIAALALALLIAAGVLVRGWYGAGPLGHEQAFVVPEGATLASVAADLEQQGALASASGFRLRARLLRRGGAIKAGEFLLPKRASPAAILSILEGNEYVRHFVTVPEGIPAIMVHDRLGAERLLTGTAAVPPEGSVLPDSYAFERGERRQAVLARMQTAMTRTLAELWAKRARDIAVQTPQQAVILASIVEKETGKPAERAVVAGLYSNRLKLGMPLQADPTVIYPITQGRPLGRRIKASELAAVNGYNTYAMAGLPRGPITNPGRASIAAVLNPARTGALYMVADGTGGHVFAATLAEHNRNVAKWFAIRRARGEL